MKLQKSLLVAATAALMLFASACSDDDDAPAISGPMTLKQFAVNDLNNRTTDTAEPIEINDLQIDDSNEDPAEYDDVLQSS